MHSELVGGIEQSQGKPCSLTCWAAVPAVPGPVEVLGAGFRRQQRVLQGGHLPLQLTALCGSLLPLLVGASLLGTHVSPARKAA